MIKSKSINYQFDYKFEDINVFHQKTKLKFVIGSRLEIRHESLSCFADFNEMRELFDEKIVERFREELSACFFDCLSISTIVTYCNKLREITNIVSRLLVDKGGRVTRFSDNADVWGAFLEWLPKNINMKAFLRRCNGEEGWLWADEFGLLIDKIRSKNRQKRAAVKAADPISGALTETEVRDITYAVCKGYENGLLQLEHLTAFILCLVLGYRNSQLIKIKITELDYVEAEKGWHLKVEIIKQKRKSSKSYVRIKMPPLINSLLDHVVPICRARNKTHLIHKSTGEAGLIISETEIAKLPDDPCRGNILMARIEDVIYRLGVRSDRVVNGRINLNFVRFKHTLLTRAAINGASAHELMELGLHSCTESAQSYIDSIPEAQARIKEELGPALTSIAKLFLGSPYEGGYEQAVQEMPESIKRHYGIAAAKPIGVCGGNINCTDHAPIACLLCSKFQPFRDAPFGEYKEYLISECSAQPDEKVKGIISEYIQACDMWVERLSVGRVVS